MTARNRLEVAWQCIAKLRTLRISFCAFTAQLKTLTEPYRKSNLRKTVNGVFCGAVISGEQVRFSIRIYTMSKSLVFKGNEITPFDNGDNKIWFTSSQMAKLLEYKNEKSVTNLYNANKDEFSDDMTMVTETMTNGINNNLRKKKVRIFSVRGAHLIGMLANTDVAKSLRRWLLDLAEKESKPQTGLANLDMNELKTLTINEMQN
ncbi:Bro-N domain-containing protein, partial [Proteus mirabilis]|nr:Bro-N domain-containing protein [Proteus mirabilis]ELT7780397.1 Bro-N domain-containing protein [Proteus mirabilis]HEK1867463.1 Bro-N domain-containing protein [Proteus mirabilis]